MTRIAKEKRPVRMPSVASIVARSYPDNVIGVENRLPWRLRSDLKNFKSLTTDHAVIMGRRTLESIGKSLSNRLNIVLTRKKNISIENVICVNDPETALFFADVFSIINLKKKLFVIGGEEIYNTFEKYINTVYLTEVFCGRINGDAKFEMDFSTYEKDGKSTWIIRKETEYPKGEYDEYPFRITHYDRRRPNHRCRMKSEFLSHDPEIVEYLETYVSVVEPELCEPEPIQDENERQLLLL